MISPVVDYIESQFQKVESKDGMTDSDMIHLLGGNGGSQVDVVFYIIVNRKSLRTYYLDKQLTLSQESNLLILNIYDAYLQ